jgi:Membrane protein involved in the export of O-antigen and teichoic acid
MNQRKAGVVLSYLSMGLDALASFICLPFLVKLLGKGEFGLYQLVGAIIAYLLIMDFGLSNTTTRYYARYQEQGKQKEKENMLALSAIFYGFVAVLILVIGFSLLYFFLPVYQNTLSPQDFVTAKKLFTIMLLNVAIVIPANIFAAVINANQKFIFAKTLVILTLLLRPTTIVLMLHLWPKALTIVYIHTIFNFLVVTANIIYCCKFLDIKMKLHRFEWKLLKELILFSLFVFLAVAMEQSYWRSGQLILGALIGTGVVAVYAIAMKLDIFFTRLADNISAIFLPQLSQISAHKSFKEQTNEVFLKVSRLQLMVMSIFLCGFILYGKTFLNFWLGAGFDESYYYSLIIMFALFIPLTQSIGIWILQAQNKHYFRAYVYTASAIFNIFLGIFLVKNIGAKGCAIATAISILLGQGLAMNLYYKKIGLALKSYFENLLKIIPACLIVFLIGLAGEQFFINQSLAVFLVKIILFILLFLAAFYFGFMNAYEKNLLKSLYGKK